MLNMNASKSTSESQLVYAVMRELGKHGAVFRTNAGQFYTKSGQRVSGLPKGFADVMVVLPSGRVAFVEVKTDSGKLSPEQKGFLEKMRGLGALAGVARSVQDALEICGFGI